jgi:hypothetical protein
MVALIMDDVCGRAFPTSQAQRKTIFLESLYLIAGA